MVAVMLMSVALVGLLCFVAYTLATYALPFMLGLAAARFAYDIRVMWLRGLPDARRITAGVEDRHPL